MNLKSQSPMITTQQCKENNSSNNYYSNNQELEEIESVGSSEISTPMNRIRNNKYTLSSVSILSLVNWLRNKIDLHQRLNIKVNQMHKQMMQFIKNYYFTFRSMLNKTNASFTNNIKGLELQKKIYGMNTLKEYDSAVRSKSN